ncbi:MAG: Flp pilus assembly complex ATPase component TadA, partial [Planctomycetaceae bacterium]|nr:Flp pilus assembly complex ATPase component TadA [Planctomycetaceae bacterium]
MDTKDIYTQSIRHFLAPVVPLLDDESITEIMINGPKSIYYEKSGRLYLSEITFEKPALLQSAAINIAEYCGRQIGGTQHSMDARLPDGSRVHIIVPPSSRVGACITIRKFKKSVFNLDTLVQWNSLTEESAEFLRICVQLHKNIIISGGTGTGKTSMLNALSTAIPDQERVIVIEDSSELQLNQPHTVYLEAQQPQSDGSGQVTIRDLFVDSLRMRPDRIVIGEVRRG